MEVSMLEQCSFTRATQIELDLLEGYARNREQVRQAEKWTVPEAHALQVCEVKAARHPLPPHLMPKPQSMLEYP